MELPTTTPPTTGSGKNVLFPIIAVLVACSTLALLTARRSTTQPSAASAGFVMIRSTSSHRLVGVDELRHVLLNRIAHPRQRKHLGDRYLPFFGVTCVMAITDTSLAWARTFHAKMEADPLVKSQMALLSPESYHVTLHGLEEMLPGMGPSDAEALFQRYAEVQRQLDLDLAGLETLRFRVIGAPRAGQLQLRAEASNTEVLLREAERHLVSSLLPIRNDQNNSFGRQVWHMSLSYPVKGDRSTAVAAQQRIDALAAASGGYPLLEFHRPKICSYRTMLQFDPLTSFETQRQVKESNRLTDEAVTELQYILEQRWRRTKQRKASRGNHHSLYGLTVLMRVNDTQSDGWATRLHQHLLENSDVTGAIALLSPESYHVTLKTLDPILPKRADERAPSLLSFVEALREAQRALDELMHSRDAPPLSFVPRRSNLSGVLDLAAASPETDVMLRKAEDVVAHALSHLANSAVLRHSRQQWHLTVGYPVQGDRYNERMRKLQEVFQGLFKEGRGTSGGVPGFRVDPPQVATSRSVERFVPLFQLNTMLP